MWYNKLNSAFTERKKKSLSLNLLIRRRPASRSSNWFLWYHRTFVHLIILSPAACINESTPLETSPPAVLTGADFISLSNFFNVVCAYNTQYFSSDLHNNPDISYMQVHFSKLDFWI